MIRICKVCTKEFKAKPSRVKKGWGNFCSRPCSTKAIKTGIKFTEEHKRKIGLAHKGKKNWRKGVYESIKYRAIHQWVNVVLGKPDTCKHCGKHNLKGKQIHWANVSQSYLRDIKDWIRLCASCHKIYDQAKSAI